MKYALVLGLIIVVFTLVQHNLYFVQLNNMKYTYENIELYKQYNAEQITPVALYDFRILFSMNTGDYIKYL